MIAPPVHPFAHPLALLQTLHDALDPAHKKTFKDHATGLPTHPTALEMACLGLLNLAPDEHNEKNLATLRAGGPLMNSFRVPLLLWAQGQPWRESIDAQAVALAWRKHTSRAVRPALPHATVSDWQQAKTKAGAQNMPMALHQLANLVRFPKEAGIPMDPSTLSTMFKSGCQLIEWSALKKNPGYAAKIALDLAAVVEEQDAQTPGLLGPHWQDEIGRACDALLDTRTFLRALLESSISPALRLGVTGVASSDMWMDPELVPLIAPVLPPNEKDRYLLLPWTKSRSTDLPGLIKIAARTNEQMMALYCPQMHQVVSIGAAPSDWTNRQKMKSLLALFKKKPAATLSLPEDFDLGTSV